MFAGIYVMYLQLSSFMCFCFKISSLIERSKTIYKYHKNTHISGLANFVSSTIKYFEGISCKENCCRVECDAVYSGS